MWFAYIVGKYMPYLQNLFYINYKTSIKRKNYRNSCAEGENNLKALHMAGTSKCMWVNMH